MILTEKKMNLFEAGDKYYLAHCISADAGFNDNAMGLGIVVEFNKRFHMKSKIRRYAQENSIKVGDSILIDKVFNLITKGKYYGKPSYNTLCAALDNMKDQMLENNIKYIAMPKIGSGLDKLSWPQVKEIIKEVFNDTDIEILICYL